MFHISLLAVPALCKSNSSESAYIRREREIVRDVVVMEQLEMADAPPASSCPSLCSAGGSFSPPHLRLSFLLAFLLPIPPSKAVSQSFSLWLYHTFLYLFLLLCKPCKCDLIGLFYIYFVYLHICRIDDGVWAHNFLVLFSFYLLYACVISFSFLSINPSNPPPLHPCLPHPLQHTHWHSHTRRSVHTVSGRQTSGLQGESSSPSPTVWIRHLLCIAPHPSPLSLGAVNPKQTVEWVGWGKVEDGWMTNGGVGVWGGVRKSRVWMDSRRVKVISYYAVRWHCVRTDDPLTDPDFLHHRHPLTALVLLSFYPAGRVIGCWG